MTDTVTVTVGIFTANNTAVDTRKMTNINSQKFRGNFGDSTVN